MRPDIAPSPDSQWGSIAVDREHAPSTASGPIAEPPPFPPPLLALLVLLFAGLVPAVTGSSAVAAGTPTATAPVATSADPTRAIAAETIAVFDAAAGEHPENVAVAPSGALWVTLHQAAAVWRRSPGGETATFRLPVDPGPRGETRLNGVVADDRGAVVAVASSRPAAAGLWRVGMDGLWLKLADLPVEAGANGLAVDAGGAFYVADDRLGRIWILRPGGPVAVWSAAPALGRQAGPGRAPYGANGIAVEDSAIWVSNPSQATIVRLPILPDGTAGVPEVVHAGAAVAGIDDFAFGADGVLYAADILSNAVVRFDREGASEVDLGSDARLAQPTAVRIGPTGPADPPAGDAVLYVTSAAFAGAASGDAAVHRFVLDLPSSGSDR